MASFLESISIHEENSKKISLKFNQLQNALKESIELEKLIYKMSANQQIINVQEYVQIHERVSKLIIFFSRTQLNDKDDFVMKTVSNFINHN